MPEAPFWSQGSGQFNIRFLLVPYSLESGEEVHSLQTLGTSVLTLGGHRWELLYKWALRVFSGTPFALMFMASCFVAGLQRAGGRAQTGEIATLHRPSKNQTQRRTSADSNCASHLIPVLAECTSFWFKCVKNRLKQTVVDRLTWCIAFGGFFLRMYRSFHKFQIGNVILQSHIASLLQTNNLSARTWCGSPLSQKSKDLLEEF